MSENILFLASLGRPGGQEPPLPSPADAHVYGIRIHSRAKAELHLSPKINSAAAEG
jgi:hypothetical protein